MNETKSFPLRVLLTVTTGRLLTEPKDGGNGIGDIYDILGWMTDDSPMTHQLPRFAEECKPWLNKWFPEITIALACMTKLDKWLKADRTGGQEGIKMWLTELKMLQPLIKDSYDVPRLPRQVDHVRKDPLAELVEICEDKSKIVVIATNP